MDGNAAGCAGSGSAAGPRSGAVVGVLRGAAVSGARVADGTHGRRLDGPTEFHHGAQRDESGRLDQPAEALELCLHFVRRGEGSRNRMAIDEEGVLAVVGSYFPRQIWEAHLEREDK